jgi:hypothetical protein
MTLSIWTQNLLRKHHTALSSWPSLLPSGSTPLALDKAVSYIGQQRCSDRSLVPARLGKRGRPGNLALPTTNASLDLFVVATILLLLLLLLHIVLPYIVIG